MSWTCKKCGKRKTKNGGWTNLLSHLRSCIGEDFSSVYDNACKERNNNHNDGGLGGYVLRLSNTEKEMFQWIELIVMKNLPVGFIDCPYVRNMSKLKPVSAKTLRQHVIALSKVMKEKIKAELPSKFVVVFDGWTEGTEHFIAISASYTVVDSTTGKEVPVQVMLSMQPLLSDGIEGMTAADHLQHISTVLGLYGKQCSDILCLAGDNCSVNQCMARTLQVPLLGCGSHKLNLAVRLWMHEEPGLEAILSKVSHVMKKASTLKVASKLRALTHYSAVQENAMRWSSTYQMVSRFLKIQQHLSAIVDLLAIFPTHIEMDILARAHVVMKKFDEVTVMLQKENISFLRVREIFDEVLQDFPSFESHLGSDADIVQNPVFEKAVVQISKGLSLSEDQRTAVAVLLKAQQEELGASTADTEASSDNTQDEEELREETYTEALERCLKRQKTMTADTRDIYCNLDMLPGTSVNCERQFSLAKHILTDTRKRTSAGLFEALLLLKVNRRLWNEYSVGQAMGRSSMNGSDHEDHYEAEEEETDTFWY